MLTILNILIGIYIAFRWIINASVWFCVYGLYIQILISLCFTIIGIPVALALGAFFHEFIEGFLEDCFSLDITKFQVFRIIQAQLHVALFKDS